MNMLHFDTSFWSRKPTDTGLPDFNSGLTVLHRKLKQSKVENDEVIQFFKDRIATEEQYATQLCRSKTLHSNGFAADEGATLKSSFLLLKSTNQQQGSRHRALADALRDNVLDPLIAFHEQYQDAVSTRKMAMDTQIKQFEQQAKETDRAKQLYQRRCRDADAAEDLAIQKAAALATSSTLTPPLSDLERPDESSHDPQPAPDQQDTPRSTADQPPTTSENLNSSIQLGSQMVSHSSFEQMVQNMQTAVPQQDYRVPILGKYTHTSTGENIARWLQQNVPQCKDSPAMAEVIGQQLIHPYQVLRLVGQRGSKFVPSPNTYYQWRTLAQADADNTAASGMFNLSLFDRNNAANTLEPHKKARWEAERADETYQSTVKRLDQLRMAIDEALFLHFAVMEQVELRRITVIKKAFTEYTSCLTSILPVDKTTVEEMVANQESIKPSQDIQFIVQNYFQGSFTPRAILYENYYHGIEHDQIFGVSLAELATAKDDKVPLFIRRILSSIEEGSMQMDANAKKSLWSTRLPLEQAHSARADVNVGSDRVDKPLLMQHEPGVLIALLRLYLMELSECLFTQDMYTPLQAVYTTGKNVDTSTRVVSVSNLVALLPAVNFAVLQAIAQQVSEFVKETSPDEQTLNEIYQSLGHAVVHPPVQTLTTQASKTPSLLMKDLIEHYSAIFTETTLKSHADNVARQRQRVLQASPLTVSTDINDKKRNGSRFMTFIRTSTEEQSPTTQPPISPNSAGTPTSSSNSKWSFSVFRSNSLERQPSTLTPTTSRPATSPGAKPSTTFTPSAIINDSPPLSPSATTDRASINTLETKDLPAPATSGNDAKSPTTTIMFDVAELAQQHKNSPTAAVPDDVDDQDLDPFFADD
ncbi:hypothetical protein DM01DRAFT_1337202 [Hesseltinella vesiculosa]|uniref:Rho-GAP domain-containing protein n=1 Tax=Hesseltinella vesiculosa TaxID=101127 RepID=A0A1X2GE94_9FUNG|nr:hypothetical protein DM01DRAFT_1337202 [Hesseltinella vesiculosa]